MTLEKLKKLCDEASPGHPEIDDSGRLEGADAAFWDAARTYMPLLLAVAEAADEYLNNTPRTYEENLSQALHDLDIMD